MPDQPWVPSELSGGDPATIERWLQRPKTAQALDRTHSLLRTFLGGA